jgi:signal transduction histidine kinase
MVKLLFTGLFFLTFFYAFAEEPERIKTLLKNFPESTGEERMKASKELAEYYIDTLAEKAVEYGLEYLNIAAQINVKYTGDANIILGSAYHNQLNFDKSLFHYQKALEISESLCDTNLLLLAKTNVGNTAVFLHDYKKALEFTLPVLDVYRSKADSVNIIPLLILTGKIYRAMDENLKGLQFFIESEQMAIRLKRNDYIAWSRYWIGVMQIKLGNLNDARAIFTENIKLYHSIPDRYGALGCKQKLGDIYLMMGKFGEAYDLFFDSYENRSYLAGSKSEKHFLGTNYQNLGRIFFQTDDFKQALDYYDKGFDLAEKNSFDDLKSEILQSKAECYFKMNEFDKALTCFEEARSFFVKSGNNFGIAGILSSFGEIELAKNDIANAIKNYNEALQINQRIGNKFGEAQNHQQLAECYIISGKPELSKKHILQGLILAEEVGVKRLILKYYQSYIKLSGQTGQSREASKYFDKYIPLSIEINEANKTELSRLLVKYYKTQADAKTIVIKQESELSKLFAEKSLLKSRQYLLLFIFSVILLVIGVTGFIRKLKSARMLEKMVGERTRELRESEEKLREVNATKERFFSIIAHDLKSPFSSLIGFADLLHNEYEEFSEEQRKEFIEIIRNSSEEIFSLLENLLEWTLSSTNQVQFFPENTDLHQVAEQAISLLEKNATNKNISIQNQVQLNTLVFADENMMQTVVRNLLSNAIKFTGNGGEIKMETSIENGFVKFSITDTGIGISKENLENLFNISTQITQKGTNNEHGTGLGLLLCKDFLIKNGSQIKVESELNQGTKFSFTLPAIQNS